MNSLKRGALIVIEGVDRSGKSTQCKKLVESLNAQNMKASLVTFPDRTTQIGGVIDKYLKQNANLCDEAIHLLFTANRWEKRAEMEKLLNDGVTLIVDRYSYSGIVYSYIKKNMSLQWCQDPEKGLLKPDLVFLLMLSEQEMEKRPNYGAERYENKLTQQKVTQAYLNLSQLEANWEIITADDSIEVVHEILLNKIIARIPEVQKQPLKNLSFQTFRRNGVLTIV